MDFELVEAAAVTRPETPFTADATGRERATGVMATTPSKAAPMARCCDFMRMLRRL
jgi:hypothetical protein